MSVLEIQSSHGKVICFQHQGLWSPVSVILLHKSHPCLPTMHRKNSLQFSIYYIPFWLLFCHFFLPVVIQPPNLLDVVFRLSWISNILLHHITHTLGSSGKSSLSLVFLYLQHKYYGHHINILVSSTFTFLSMSEFVVFEDTFYMVLIFIFPMSNTMPCAK